MLHPVGTHELAARRAVTEYKIDTITGDKRGAGTDAEVLELSPILFSFLELKIRTLLPGCI